MSGLPLLDSQEEELREMSMTTRELLHKIEFKYALLLQHEVDATAGAIDAAGGGDGGGNRGVNGCGAQSEVERFFVAAYEGMKKVRGETDDLTLNYLVALAKCYSKEGHNFDALFALQEVLLYRKELFPSDTIAIESAKKCLLDVHLNLVELGESGGQDLVEAIALFEEALSREDELDPELSADIKLNLAKAHEMRQQEQQQIFHQQDIPK